MDVNDYTFIIQDHNSRILCDNSLNETNQVIYIYHGLACFLVGNDQFAIILRLIMINQTGCHKVGMSYLAYSFQFITIDIPSDLS